MRLLHKLLLHALFGHLILSALLYGFFFFFSKSYLERTLIKRSVDEAEAIFNALYQGMLKGFTREEIEGFLKSFQKETMKVHIEFNLSPNIQVLERDFLIVREGPNLRIKYLLKAKQVCLRCHTGVKEGDLLGILTINNSLQEEFKRINQGLLLFVLIFSIFPLLGVYLIGKIQSRKLEKPLLELRDRIKGASKFEKLIEREELIKGSKTGIFEFDELLKTVDEFLEAVKRLAVDRDIFEFEMRLLEKFVITSELIKDWKYYVHNLMIEVNKIVEIPLIFALFYVEDELYDVEIFWLKNPTESLKRYAEEQIKSVVEERIRINNLSFIHNVAQKTVDLSDKEDFPTLSFKTKSLILSAPKVGGVAGVGLSHKSLTSTQEACIETILSTLLNVIGSVKAISKYTKELEFYATRDPLTQLYNQRVFWELLEYEVERAKRYNYKFALLILDLDNFKLINDTWGHAFGDKFLIEVARILENCKRKGDILARYGGDEFAMVLPMCDLTQAVSVAERIKESLQNFKMSTPDEKIASSTGSIGIAIFPDHGESSKDLFVLADTLMYKVKKEGKNKIIYPTTEEILGYQREITETTLLVKEAVEKKRIIPYFQPIYDLKTGELFGCEVLMRLEMDEEIIPAQRFIGIAEAMGLIMEMDFINMEKALELAKKNNYQAYYFFNLSPKALIIPEFLSKIRDLIAKYNFPPEKIIFELTERETVKNLRLLEKFIRNLQDYGFKFCIDDFGSGFSSFQYIKHFMIDLVKIEGDFVVGLNQKALTDLAIVESIVALCKRLNIKMVAEYVENEKIIESLKALGVEYGQGYYLGKPTPELPV